MKVEMNTNGTLFIEEYVNHGKGVCPSLDTLYGVITLAYSEIEGVYDAPCTVRLGNSELYTEGGAVCCSGTFPSIGCVVVKKSRVKSVIVVEGESTSIIEADKPSVTENMRINAYTSIYKGENKGMLKDILYEIGKYPRDIQKVVFCYDDLSEDFEDTILRYGSNVLLLKEG